LAIISTDDGGNDANLKVAPASNIYELWTQVRVLYSHSSRHTKKKTCRSPNLNDEKSQYSSAAAQNTPPRQTFCQNADVATTEALAEAVAKELFMLDRCASKIDKFPTTATVCGLLPSLSFFVVGFG
jgi:hypothetical protein